MKPQDDSKSISSSSTISGSGNPSISSSGSTSQLGFLDEIKKLAEKRLNENGLITDTLNKTRNLEKMMTKGPKTLISGQDDENRKRHGKVSPNKYQCFKMKPENWSTVNRF